MTTSLDCSASDVPSAHSKQSTESIKAPVTEGEIPKFNGVRPSKPIVNGNHTNGLANGHQDTNSDPFKLASEYAYTPRKLKVFTIGAGFSGLLMAHKFQHRFPEMQDIVDHTLFEAHHEVGGTW